MKYGECVYNKHILCTRYPDDTETCTDPRCGWNPPVAKARLDAIRAGDLVKDQVGKRHLAVEADDPTIEITETE